MSKVAYLVSDYFAPSHTFVRREVAALRKLGVQVVPFSVQAGPSNSKDAQCLLGRTIFDYALALLWALFRHPLQFGTSWLVALRHRQPGARGLLWSQFHLVEAIVLARLLATQKCTHLHNHFANSAATVGMIAAHFGKIPWSLTLHGISETDFPAGMLLREKLERAQFVACASYFMQAQAMRMVDFKHWTKMSIVRCGIDFANLPPENHGAVDALRDTGPALISVGRLSAEKGYFGLLPILAALVADGFQFSMTIVGDGPSAAAIHEMVNELALTDHVRFTGALPESETLSEINQSDIFVLPSLMEGLPVVLIEALALGKAAVATRVAGIPELIEDGHSGLLFTPSDWSDLDRQLRRILHDPELRRSFGAEGFKAASLEFGSEIAASRMINLLRAIPG
ncbi:MAG: glycosyltransferase [Sphingorhabdus sp.]